MCQVINDWDMLSSRIKLDFCIKFFFQSTLKYLNLNAKPLKQHQSQHNPQYVYFLTIVCFSSNLCVSCVQRLVVDESIILWHVFLNLSYHFIGTNKIWQDWLRQMHGMRPARLPGTTSYGIPQTLSQKMFPMLKVLWTLEP